jgi:nicotinamide-nucleotide amidase
LCRTPTRPGPLWPASQLRCWKSTETTARLLAEGIRQRLNAPLALSITGIAGPTAPASGPDATRPVGLVYIALATPETTHVREVKIAGDRDRVRLWSTQHALEMLRHHLL